MTTIAMKDGVIAWDTLLTQVYENGYPYYAGRFAEKVSSYDLPWGETIWVAVCGNAAILDMIRRGFDKHHYAKEEYHLTRTKPILPIFEKEMQGDVAVIMPESEGVDTVFMYGDVGWFSIDVSRYGHVMGSGGDVARGAMLAGATPTQAVQLASKIDQGTGDEVITIDLKNATEEEDG